MRQARSSPETRQDIHQHPGVDSVTLRRKGHESKFKENTRASSPAGIPGKTEEKPGSVNDPHPTLCFLWAPLECVHKLSPRELVPVKIKSPATINNDFKSHWSTCRTFKAGSLSTALDTRGQGHPLPGWRWRSKAWKPQRREIPAPSPHGSRSVLRGLRPESSSPNKDLLGSWNVQKND